tara:strand:- start:251 stop:1450 length:1200 start_codon:yes stop_codon:yes gene_type:complete
MLKNILTLFTFFITSYGEDHHCIKDEGFTWCESSQKCQNFIIEPCLPITKECVYCLTENFGDNTNCGEGCSIDILSQIQNLGIGTDTYGCLMNKGSIWCDSLNRCINPILEECRENSINPQNLCHDISCAMFCPNGYQVDENGCDICLCNTLSEEICPFDEQNCNYTYVCPKVTEITTCSEGGIPGYTTYQLSLTIKENTDVKNIYAIYGNTLNDPTGSLMFFPPAYQHDSSFNSNIGGINPELIQYEPSLTYDSWITIGVIDGDPQNLISSIGIDFTRWTGQTPLNVNNGAVFLLDSNEILMNTNNEYIIAQVTIDTTLDTNVIIGVHGKHYNSHEAWDEKNVIFHLKSPQIRNSIPENCLMWFDGCNYCYITDDQSCVNEYCIHSDFSYCVTYNTGH